MPYMWKPSMESVSRYIGQRVVSQRTFNSHRARSPLYIKENNPMDRIDCLHLELVGPFSHLRLNRNWPGPDHSGRNIPCEACGQDMITAFRPLRRTDWWNPSSLQMSVTLGRLPKAMELVASDASGSTDPRWLKPFPPFFVLAHLIRAREVAKKWDSIAHSDAACSLSAASSSTSKEPAGAMALTIPGSGLGSNAIDLRCPKGGG